MEQNKTKQTQGPTEDKNRAEAAHYDFPSQEHMMELALA